jgi:hypothetical protein
MYKRIKEREFNMLAHQIFIITKEIENSYWSLTADKTLNISKDGNFNGAEQFSLEQTDKTSCSTKTFTALLNHGGQKVDDTTVRYFLADLPVHVSTTEVRTDNNAPTKRLPLWKNPTGWQSSSDDISAGYLSLDLTNWMSAASTEFKSLILTFDGPTSDNPIIYEQDYTMFNKNTDDLEPLVVEKITNSIINQRKFKMVPSKNVVMIQTKLILSQIQIEACVIDTKYKYQLSNGSEKQKWNVQLKKENTNDTQVQWNESVRIMFDDPKQNPSPAAPWFLNKPFCSYNIENTLLSSITSDSKYRGSVSIHICEQSTFTFTEQDLSWSGSGKDAKVKIILDAFHVMVGIMVESGGSGYDDSSKLILKQSEVYDSDSYEFHLFMNGGVLDRIEVGYNPTGQSILLQMKQFFIQQTTKKEIEGQSKHNESVTLPYQNIIEYDFEKPDLTESSFIQVTIEHQGKTMIQPRRNGDSFSFPVVMVSDTQTNVATNTKTNVDTNTKTNINVDTNTKSNTNVDTNTKSNTNVDTKTKTKINVESTTKARTLDTMAIVLIVIACIIVIGSLILGYYMWFKGNKATVNVVEMEKH